MHQEEGYVKFQCQWGKAPAPDSTIVSSLNVWRDKMYDLGLIGAYPDGIGYGNISERIGTGDHFVISGTATGTLEKLDENHYTEVVAFDASKNSLTCCGPIRASSESLTHGSLYREDPEIKGVIHIHHLGFWEKLLGQVPTTLANVLYGTPAMAEEMVRLYHESDLPEKKIVVMGGHHEGILTFGESLDEAGNILLDYYSQYFPEK